MKPESGNLIAASSLILMGLWGYVTAVNPSPTALITVVGGGLLLFMHNGIKKENKVVSHIAVLLTLILALSLFMPLKGAINRGNGLATGRIIVMIVACLTALVIYVNSFRKARANRKSLS